MFGCRCCVNFNIPTTVTSSFLCFVAAVLWLLTCHLLSLVFFMFCCRCCVTFNMPPAVTGSFLCFVLAVVWLLTCHPLSLVVSMFYCRCCVTFNMPSTVTGSFLCFVAKAVWLLGQTFFWKRVWSFRYTRHREQGSCQSWDIPAI